MRLFSVRRRATVRRIAAALMASLLLPYAAAQPSRGAAPGAPAPATPVAVRASQPLAALDPRALPAAAPEPAPRSGFPIQENETPSTLRAPPPVPAPGASVSWLAIVAAALALVALVLGGAALALMWRIREQLGSVHTQMHQLGLQAIAAGRDAQDTAKQINSIEENFEGLRQLLDMAQAAPARLKPVVTPPARGTPDRSQFGYAPMQESEVLNSRAAAAPQRRQVPPVSAPPRSVPLVEFLTAVQDAADAVLADGIASDKELLTSSVAARMSAELKHLLFAKAFKICAHNSSVGLDADFSNPDFLTVTGSDGQGWLLPSPRAQYAHSFTKYYEGNSEAWPRFKAPATCSMDASSKAVVVSKGQL